MIKRIVSRPDFDGVICAVLLKEALGGDLPVLWAQPNELQHGHVAVTSEDAVANLPFAEPCGLWFDHHVSNKVDRPFNGLFRLAPSAARVIYDFFRPRLDAFEHLVEQADKIDSAALDLDEIVHPEKYPYVLISMAVSVCKKDLQFCDELVELFRASDMAVIMADPRVRERCEQVIAVNRAYETYLTRHTIVDGPVSITDFRGLSGVPDGNRFLVYSLFPQAIVNMKLSDEGDRVAVKLGHSIVTSGCAVNVGNLLKRYGGGGHRGAGACRIRKADADAAVREMIDVLQQNRPLDCGSAA